MSKFVFLEDSAKSEILKRLNKSGLTELESEMLLVMYFVEQNEASLKQKIRITDLIV